MFTTTNIHNIKKIESDEISRVSVDHEAYSRTLTLTDADGNQFVFNLFSDSFGNLIVDHAETVTQSESDEMEIPAFLKRQAD